MNLLNIISCITILSLSSTSSSTSAAPAFLSRRADNTATGTLIASPLGATETVTFLIPANVVVAIQTIDAAGNLSPPTIATPIPNAVVPTNLVPVPTVNNAPTPTAMPTTTAANFVDGNNGGAGSTVTTFVTAFTTSTITVTPDATQTTSATAVNFVGDTNTPIVIDTNNNGGGYAPTPTITDTNNGLVYGPSPTDSNNGGVYVPSATPIDNGNGINYVTTYGAALVPTDTTNNNNNIPTENTANNNIVYETIITEQVIYIPTQTIIYEPVTITVDLPAVPTDTNGYIPVNGVMTATPVVDVPSSNAGDIGSTGVVYNNGGVASVPVDMQTSVSAAMTTTTSVAEMYVPTYPAGYQPTGTATM
ncbi:hypothetical protein HDU76_002686 [Blyttiomyces sp. JEL0837]|nr:hypothetical protein HDU76_002686 [Blyttiomyces sp. JEL0837]